MLKAISFEAFYLNNPILVLKVISFQLITCSVYEIRLNITNTYGISVFLYAPQLYTFNVKFY